MNSKAKTHKAPPPSGNGTPETPGRGAPREAEEPTLRRELYAIFVLYIAIAVIPLLIGWLSSS